MKKTLLIAGALALTSLSSFSQGNVNFQASHSVYSATTGTLAGSQGDYVALLFFTSQSAADTALNGIFATGQSGSPTTSASPNANYSIATAWTDLLNGALIVDGTTAGQPAVGNITSTTGSFTYNGGTAFSADNVTGGTTYYAVEVAWAGAATTVSAASAAHDSVGWSQVFSYTPTTGIVTAPTMTTALVGTFGVGGAVPEPSTMALAALGGASLLLFRRRK